MEKLNPNVIALSLGITSLILYVVCLIFVAILPLPTIISIANSLFHDFDFSKIAVKNITLSGSIAGLFGWFAISVIIGYIFAFAYNWVLKKS